MQKGDKIRVPLSTLQLPSYVDVTVVEVHERGVKATIEATLTRRQAVPIAALKAAQAVGSAGAALRETPDPGATLPDGTTAAAAGEGGGE